MKVSEIMAWCRRAPVGSTILLERDPRTDPELAEVMGVAEAIFMKRGLVLATDRLKPETKGRLWIVLPKGHPELSPPKVLH